MPKNAVYVGRPTKWGNPCKVGDIVFMGKAVSGTGETEIRPATAGDCKRWYSAKVTGLLLADPKRLLEPLRGKDLACWCPLDQPCHADALLILANR